jgi:uncharacterized RDD family membrane protein YckC
VHQEPDLVTGDAVVLELRLATLASRGVAFLLDVLLQFAVLFLLILGVLFLGIADRALLAAVVLTIFILVRVGYPVAFETLAGGRTLGKMALGLRVVRDDGGPIRFRHALARGLAGAIVDFGPALVWGAVAIVVSLCSPKSKRVGDYLAGTVVIRDRVPETAAPVIQMPPQLAGWAARLDLSGLTDDLALSIRQYLGRVRELRPEARDALGFRLAEELGGRIAAPLPPGVPPWAYLTAVLAERRNRDQARRLGRQQPQFTSQPAYAPQPVYAPQPAFPRQHHVPPPEPAEPPAHNPFTPPG